MSAPTLSCVVISMGQRPQALGRALDSVRAQTGEPIEVVVVGNGADVPDLPPWARFLRLPENVGIPAGRNAGVTGTTGELVLFLDDDGWLPDPATADRVRGAFEAAPDLGVLAMRIVDPELGVTQRRHVPRLRVGDALRSSDVTTFLGGACVIRREAFDRAGELPGGFFFAHEETDLSWRMLDRGWRVHYEAQAVMFHPATSPARHDVYYRLNARNRVWLARRNLPAPLVPLYLATWVALTVARNRDAHALRTWAHGFVEGWRTDPGPRRPIRWATVWRMTRLGRPPII